MMWRYQWSASVLKQIRNVRNVSHCNRIQKVSRPYTGQFVRQYSCSIRKPVLYSLVSLSNHCIKSTPGISQRVLKTGLRFKGQLNRPVHRQFHTSGRRDAWPPLVWVFISYSSKFTAVLTGRTWRNWLKRQPKNVQRRICKRALVIFGLSGIAAMGTGSWYYTSHLEEAPITGRKRFIMITRDQYLKVADFESQAYLEDFKDKLISPTEPVYERIVSIAQRILKSNQDFPGIHEHSWVIHVVDDPTRNAFVLPNGHVFVFTGLIKFTENEDQFAMVLGHEMAHALMRHGAEQLSMSQFFDHIVIFVMAFLWCLMPNDGIAVVANWFYHKVMNVAVHLPYSRVLENEADRIGLILTAKACFDVRESSVLWKRMGMVDDLTGAPSTPEWLSTHPSNESRVTTLEKLIPKMIDERNACSCPLLPHIDPRKRAESLRQMTDNVLVHRATRSNLQRVSQKQKKPSIIPTYSPKTVNNAQPTDES